MVEVILTVYIGSFFFSWVLGLSYFFGVLRPRLQSRTLQNLNTHLAPQNLYWSNRSGDFRPLSESAVEKDRTDTYKSFLLITTILAFLSLPGLVLMILFVTSYHFLARPRKERRTFASALAKETSLPPNEVARLITELNS